MQQSCCTTCGCNKIEGRRERRTVDIEHKDLPEAPKTCGLTMRQHTGAHHRPGGPAKRELALLTSARKHHCGSKADCAGFTRLWEICYFYTSAGPSMVSNSLENWWQEKRRFFTRLTPYGGACEVPITLEECREHRALSEAAQPERLPPTW